MANLSSRVQELEIQVAALTELVDRLMLKQGIGLAAHTLPLLEVKSAYSTLRLPDVVMKDLQKPETEQQGIQCTDERQAEACPRRMPPDEFRKQGLM